MSTTSDALDQAGAHRQVVNLKNGVMYVYTADSPSQINAVQAAVARRGEHLAKITKMGDKAHLCSECKVLRGAMASGQLTREIINIEGGSLSLMTSSDPAVVAKLHEMAAADAAPPVLAKANTHIRADIAQAGTSPEGWPR
jgi:hypothetical protein